MKTRHAFTLVEILTVTVIIGILAALVTAAVAGAIRHAQRGKIGWNMNQMTIALDHYKAEIGEYPPDMFDDVALVRHVKKRWPRLNWQALRAAMPASSDADLIRQLINGAYSVTVNNMTVNAGNTNRQIDFTDMPPGSLPLWLGGFPNADGKLSGFFADPENPFDPSTGAFDKKVFIDWELGDLDSNKSVRLCHVNENSANVVPLAGNDIRNTFVPFVYFRGKISGGDDAYKDPNGDVKQVGSPMFGWCVPYAEDMNNGVIKWKNPTTYQLLHPGLDGSFGKTDRTVVRNIKSGVGIDLPDLDNITNFSDCKELQSVLP